jgi:hypothetical protein
LDEALEPAIRPRTVFIGAAALFAGVAGVVLLVRTDGHRAARAARAKPPAATVSSAHGVFDSFRRPDSATALGPPDTGSAWYAVSGTWGVRQHQAYVARPAKAQSMAYVDMGGKDGFVQVTVAAVKPGSGLLFRYQNLRNYLLLVAVPKYGTWNLEQVVDGRAQTLGNTGVASTRDGTVIAVQLAGPTAEVSINNTRRKSFTVSDVRGATGAGLVAAGDGSGAVRWANFVATPLAEQPPESAPTSTSVPPTGAR